MSGRQRPERGLGGFWLLGTDIYSAGFPESGEVDIAEHINGSNFVHVGIHGPTSTGGLGTGSLDLSALGGIFAPLAGRYTLGSDKTGIDPSQFHTYGVTKTGEKLGFLFDGAEFYSISKSSPSAGQRWVFDKPVYVILNLAVGGDWPGAPDGNTTDSATVTVDWIRYTP
ncbi:glycoside hydrolase family 16 protein [Gordonia iterans]|uniref:glycoside hydrolase family 16 protein n=1 Tax=Gordonia iterans TaxID=1004901 RepID=UPI001F2246BC|nr:glycoside hydrolase family 16 protein [Gordonia iterans]